MSAAHLIDTKGAGMQVRSVCADRGFGTSVDNAALQRHRLNDAVIPWGRPAAVEKTSGWRRRRLLAPLATDVSEWRLACGRPDEKTLVFPGREGRPWADHDWRNWRKRVYAPVAAEAQLDGYRPYDLRHAFCSLLIAEGLSVVEIARQAGHSPAMMLATYANVIEDVAGIERRLAEAVIRDARDRLVSEMCPPARGQRLR